MLTITTPPDLVPEAVAFMVKHGCSVKSHETHNVVTFPEGTVQEEILPRMPSSVRFKLLLPDGCVMQQTYVRFLEQSIVFYPRQCIHEDASV